LRIGDALCGAEDFQELIALAADAAEEATLLENQSPGDERSKQKNGQDAASDQASLRENIEDVADENGVQEKKNVCLLEREIFPGNFNVAQGWGMVKRNRMRMCWERMDGGERVHHRVRGGPRSSRRTGRMSAMYRIVLVCKGVPIDAGAAAARDVAEEFARRRWHQNVTCVWDGLALTLRADNDFDANGHALMDEFSDAISACIAGALDGDIEVVSVTTV
jgi:hypothetical protein